MRCQTYVKVAPISSSICHFIVGSSQFNKEGKIFSSIRRGKKSKKKFMNMDTQEITEMIIILNGIQKD